MGKYLENKSLRKPKQKESEEFTSVLGSVAVDDEVWKWKYSSIFLILVLYTI
jgi:hypothetical protein